MLLLYISNDLLVQLTLLPGLSCISLDCYTCPPLYIKEIDSYGCIL